MADPKSSGKDWGARFILRIFRWLEDKMPTRSGMANNRYLKPIAHRFLRSDLWRFTRRSVPRGVALGMLAAFLIPVGQIFAAVFLALPIRANVPIAALTTFITNPITYPFWIAAANQIGKFALRVDALTDGQPLNSHVGSEFGMWISWFVREAGVTAFGFSLLAISFAALGYVVSSFGWRWWTARKWQRRMKNIDPDSNKDGE
ncbi:DUF2062 domain-containing protein [Parasphingorhabdus sp. JC815]|uniref:DUF2062 domain-containing protein n=1 Tax=Parasphingorhabdus sp. JC815 TaxID=3232140 RepID=UPI00345B239E